MNTLQLSDSNFLGYDHMFFAPVTNHATEDPVAAVPVQESRSIAHTKQHLTSWPWNLHQETRTSILTDSTFWWPLHLAFTSGRWRTLMHLLPMHQTMAYHLGKVQLGLLPNMLTP
jgi:hypothetical protein